MKSFKTVLKILTMVSYFLPFVFFFISCDGSFGLEVGFNKEEYKKNILANSKKVDSASSILDSLDAVIVPVDTIDIQSDSSKAGENISSNENNNENKFTHFFMEAYSFALCPTNRSLSGFGLLTFHRDLSFILIAVSMLISILVLFEKQVILIKKNVIVLYATSLSCLLLFIICCLFISDVDLEWGIGITILLTLVGLWLAIKEKKAAHHSL